MYDFTLGMKDSFNSFVGSELIKLTVQFEHYARLPFIDPRFKPRKPARNNGIVICTVREELSGVQVGGMIVCSVDDKFNPNEAYPRALARALDKTGMGRDGRRLLNDILKAKMKIADANQY